MQALAVDYRYAEVEIVTALDLSVGDIVREHGNVFQVDHILRYVDRGSLVQANYCIVIDDRDDSTDGYIGHGFWNVQGNDRRDVNRVVA
jgi:putative heme iron utilization protein